MSGSETIVRCVVTGRVQGVFYRVSTAEQAERLELRGWAKNLPDGSVEVVVAGAANSVSDLTAWLWRGPAGARVDGVSVEVWDGTLADGFVTL